MKVLRQTTFRHILGYCLVHQVGCLSHFMQQNLIPILLALQIAYFIHTNHNILTQEHENNMYMCECVISTQALIYIEQHLNVR